MPLAWKESSLVLSIATVELAKDSSVAKRQTSALVVSQLAIPRRLQ
jgi:hypothetical protein